MSTTTVQWDPFGDVVEDPYPTYRALRDEAPLYRNEQRDFWVLSRFADVHAANRDWRRFAYAGGVDLDDVGEHLRPGNFLATDPPEHAALRGLVKDAFRIGTLRARFTPIVADAVETLLDGRGSDGDAIDVGAFAWSLPIAVGAELLGFPASDIEDLRAAADTAWIEKRLEPGGSVAAVAAARRVHAYFLEQIRMRERAPREDLLTQIGRGLPGRPETAAGVASVIFAGSVDTTAMTLTNALHLLGLDPAQRALATTSPRALELAIEEVLRFESPVQAFKRTTTEDVELHGRSVPAESTVVLLYGAANRDERQFERADVFDLTRSGRRHLSFGDGIHHCIGAPLARLELHVALGELLRRAPRYELGSGHVRVASGAARGFQQLWIVPR